MSKWQRALKLEEQGYTVIFTTALLTVTPRYTNQMVMCGDQAAPGREEWTLSLATLSTMHVWFPGHKWRGHSEPRQFTAPQQAHWTHDPWPKWTDSPDSPVTPPPPTPRDACLVKGAGAHVLSLDCKPSPRGRYPMNIRAVAADRRLKELLCSDRADATHCHIFRAQL